MLDFNKITVLDLETTIKAPTPHFGASPTYPANRIVMLGYQSGETEDILTDRREIEQFTEEMRRDEHLIVGHNIAFDILYLARYGLELGHNPIWDTQKFAYIQHGRKLVQPSLETVAKSLRLPFRKDTEIKERFKAGIGADEIDRELLESYLQSDVRVTKQIFDKQYAWLSQQPEQTQKYYLEMLNGVGVTSQMTHVGFEFDTGGATKQSKKTHLVAMQKEEYLIKRYKDIYPGEFNPNSAAQIETLLWGGEVNVPIVEEVLNEEGNPVRYKSGDKKGQIKTRKGIRKQRVEPMVKPETIKLFENRGWEKKAGAKTLEYIQKYEEDSPAEDLCFEIEILRQVSKSISTYYRPYISFAVDYTLHPSYNHCVTQTGRLSSSKPNMQNINGKKESE